MTLGKCGECGKAADVYSATRFDINTQHYVPRYVCRACLKFDAPDLPPRNHLTFDAKDEPDAA